MITEFLFFCKDPSLQKVGVETCFWGWSRLFLHERFTKIWQEFFHNPFISIGDFCS